MRRPPQPSQFLQHKDCLLKQRCLLLPICLPGKPPQPPVPTLPTQVPLPDLRTQKKHVPWKESPRETVQAPATQTSRSQNVTRDILCFHSVSESLPLAISTSTKWGRQAFPILGPAGHRHLTNCNDLSVLGTILELLGTAGPHGLHAVHTNFGPFRSRVPAGPAFYSSRTPGLSFG